MQWVFVYMSVCVCAGIISANCERIWTLTRDAWKTHLEPYGRVRALASLFHTRWLAVFATNALSRVADPQEKDGRSK